MTSSLLGLPRDALLPQSCFHSLFSLDLLELYRVYMSTTNTSKSRSATLTSAAESHAPSHRPDVGLNHFGIL